jgi:D-ornithine 4,5-aminomutase subunit beta
VAGEGRAAGWIRPEVEKAGDGVVCVTLFVAEPTERARAAALTLARQMNLVDAQIIHERTLHPAEGTLFEIQGTLPAAVRAEDLVIPTAATRLSHAAIEAFVRPRKLHVVAATLGEDEHSVGMREILDIKHGGIERYGFHTHYLGTSASPDRLLDAAETHGACAVLVSTIVTHHDVHRENLAALERRARERGLRGGLLLVAGGTRVTDALARESGMDAGFGRGTTGQDVASFLVLRLRDAAEGTS